MLNISKRKIIVTLTSCVLLLIIGVVYLVYNQKSKDGSLNQDGNISGNSDVQSGGNTIINTNTKTKDLDKPPRPPE